MSLKSHKNLFITVITFGVIYSLISVVNHYNFRTYALDLGAYTNALYDYIHFQWNNSTVFKAEAENLLADHFDLYLILFSPLSLIFKTYTLLIVQISFILLGGIGIYKFFLLKQNKQFLALLAAIYFYLFFGVFSAVSYDYHSNVVAAAVVPWFFYWLYKRRLVETSLILLFILISKENVSLWMAFVCLGLVYNFRKEKYWRNFLIGCSLFCIGYFVLITSVVMPALSNAGSYPHFHYSVLGESSLEALTFLIQNPVESLRLLFVNHTDNPLADYVKAELHILLLISGLPVLFFRPQYLLMLIPIFFQKLYHDNYGLWGIDGQYSIEFAPILAIGVFSLISDIQRRNWKNLMTILVMIGVLVGTIRVMDNTIIFTDKSRIRIYKASHYLRDYDVKQVHDQLSNIPENAVVSVQSPFLPHLSFRDHIYQFPMVKDAEYIVFSEQEKLYPMEKEEFQRLTTELQNSEAWKNIYSDNGLTILKRSKDVEHDANFQK